MKRFFRLLLLGLILALVATISAVTAMRFAIHGREVAVPNFAGLTVAEAEARANAVGLIAVVENKFYSSEVPEGRIISQVPEAGVRVRGGWRVRTAQSLGPQRAQIPNVVGQSVRAAEINLSRRGLELAAVATTVMPGIPEGQVIGQSPTPNSRDVAAPKVGILAAAAEPPEQSVMPNFLGKRIAEVKPQVEAAGFMVGTITERSLSEPATGDAGGAPGTAGSSLNRYSGIIIRQFPAVGHQIEAGGAISFEVIR